MSGNLKEYQWYNYWGLLNWALWVTVLKPVAARAAEFYAGSARIEYKDTAEEDEYGISTFGLTKTATKQ